MNLGGEKKNVLVFGMGAIGGFIGWRLQRAGARVWVVCRSNYDTVRENGMRVIANGHEHLFIPDGVSDHAEKSQTPPDDLI